MQIMLFLIWGRIHPETDFGAKGNKEKGTGTRHQLSLERDAARNRNETGDRRLATRLRAEMIADPQLGMTHAEMWARIDTSRKA